MNPRFKAEVLEGDSRSYVELFDDTIGLRCHARGAADGAATMEIFITEGGQERTAKVSLGRIVKSANGRVMWRPSPVSNYLLEAAFPVDKEAKA